MQSSVKGSEDLEMLSCEEEHSTRGKNKDKERETETGFVGELGRNVLSLP